jgi:hypothetical protein
LNDKILTLLGFAAKAHEQNPIPNITKAKTLFIKLLFSMSV